MTWLIWRQHRGGILARPWSWLCWEPLLLLHGVPMHEAYARDAIDTCHLRLFEVDPGSCAQMVLSFECRWANVPNQFAGWLPFLPMLAGMLIGAPLLAGEFEEGTWQLAWTQGVTRRGWLAAKFAYVIGGACTVSFVFAAGVSWWFDPLTPNMFTTAKFNHTVLVFPTYVLVSVAIGILAGVVARRTILAAAITVGGYLAVRIPVEFYLRPRYQDAVTTENSSEAAQGWVVHNGGSGGPAPGSATPTHPIRYHPDDRFWEFQLIETAILLGVTIVLLAIAWRLVLGRSAGR